MDRESRAPRGRLSAQGPLARIRQRRVSRKSVTACSAQVGHYAQVPNMSRWSGAGGAVQGPLTAISSFRKKFADQGKEIARAVGFRQVGRGSRLLRLLVIAGKRERGDCDLPRSNAVRGYDPPGANGRDETLSGSTPTVVAMSSFRARGRASSISFKPSRSPPPAASGFGCKSASAPTQRKCACAAIRPDANKRKLRSPLGSRNASSRDLPNRSRAQ